MSTASDPARVCAVIPALDEEATIGAVVTGSARVRRPGHRRGQRLGRRHGRAGSRRGRAGRAGAAAWLRARLPDRRPCRAGRVRDRFLRRRRVGRPLGPAAARGAGGRGPRRPRRGIAGARRQEPRALAAHQRAGNWVFSRLIGRLWGIPITDLGPMRADPPREPDRAGHAVGHVRMAGGDGRQGGPLPAAHHGNAGRRPPTRRRALQGERIAARLRSRRPALRRGAGTARDESPAVCVAPRGDRSSRSADVQSRVAPLGRGVRERQ